MSQQTIARRYARALNEQAEANGVTESVDADVRAIRESLSASRELAGFFASPVVPREKKRSVVRALFGGRVSDEMLRFVGMLVDKRRENLFPAVADAYLALRDEQMGVVEVSVRTARPLAAGDEEVIARRMEEVTGKKTRLRVSVEPALRGGLVVRVGDTVYDGSVQGRLDSLRERLVHGTGASG